MPFLIMGLVAWRMYHGHQSSDPSTPSFVWWLYVLVCHILLVMPPGSGVKVQGAGLQSQVGGQTWLGFHGLGIGFFKMRDGLAKAP